MSCLPTIWLYYIIFVTLLTILLPWNLSVIASRYVIDGDHATITSVPRSALLTTTKADITVVIFHIVARELTVAALNKESTRANTIAPAVTGDHVAEDSVESLG
jgi:hypothetical protein